MKKILSFLAFIFILTTICLATDVNPVLRVGLYYEEDAMPTANLQVTNGEGYRLGFYDSTLTFIQCFYTSAGKITMTNDQNLWHKDGKFYTNDSTQGAKVLGAYHIECTSQFNDLTSAENALAGFAIQGYKGFIAYINGTYRVRLGAFTTENDAESVRAQIGGTVVGASKTAVSVYNTETGEIIFEYDGGTNSYLAVNPTKGEVAMPITWFKAMKFPGAFEYVRNGGNITVVNVVPMQDYLKGVLPWEMYPSDPLEALKAQALCARTYAYYNMGKHGSEFDICAGTHCQAYRGMERANATTNRAVDETEGQYILYNGRPINAVFHSCDGGATEDAKNVWGSEIPYLKGKIDPYEKTENAYNGVWSYEYTPQQLTDILNSKGYDAALICDAKVEYTALGNVLRVTYTDINGRDWVFNRERARTIINSSSLDKHTRSQRYTITRNGGTNASSLVMRVNNASDFDLLNIEAWAVGKFGSSQLQGNNISVITSDGIKTFSGGGQSSGNGNFVISGRGWGHNVGLSQEGAADMADLGFTAQEIIHFYYTDVTITNEE